MAMLRMENRDSTKISHASGKYIDAVADPGGGPGGGGRPLPPPPLFLDESEVRRAEKNFFLDIVPRPLPPPPLFEGLDPPLRCTRQR